MRNYDDRAISAEFQDKNGGMDNGGVLPSSQMFLHLPSEFARSALIYAAYVGHYFCDHTYTVHRNQFDYYMLAVVDSGGMFFQYNGERFEVHAGEVILLDCRRPHTYGALDSVSFRYIYFRGGSSDAYYRLLAGENGYFTRPARSVEVRLSQIQRTMSTVFRYSYTAFLPNSPVRTGAVNRCRTRPYCTQSHIWSIISRKSSQSNRLQTRST